MIVKVKKVSSFKDEDFRFLLELSTELLSKKGINNIDLALKEIAKEVTGNYENLLLLEEVNTKIIVYELDYLNDGFNYILFRSFEEGKVTYAEIEKEEK